MIVTLVSVLVALNMRGIRNSARVLETITILKLVPLLAFIVIGVFFVDPANLAWTDVPSSSAVLGTAGIVIFAFSGIEGATVPSGEVKNSARTVPLAILLALGAATVLYMAIQYVALGIMGLELANTGRVPLAAAAEVALGPAARTVMIAAAVVSMFGYLSANVLSEPRGLFAMSRDGFLPRVADPGRSAVSHAEHRHHDLRRDGHCHRAVRQLRMAHDLRQPCGAGAVLPQRHRSADSAQAQRSRRRRAIRDSRWTARAAGSVRVHRLAVLRDRARRLAAVCAADRAGDHPGAVRLARLQPHGVRKSTAEFRSLLPSQPGARRLFKLSSSYAWH